VEFHFACHALINAAGLARLSKSLEDNGLSKMVPGNDFKFDEK
jgi:hypothetical protein